MAAPYGIDVSHWEGVIDWQTASQHIDFAILKAYEIGIGQDVQYLNNRQGTTDNFVPWGSYCFFRPSSDPLTQAQEYVAAAGGEHQVYVGDIETTVLLAALEQLSGTGDPLPNQPDLKAMLRPYRGLAVWDQAFTQTVRNINIIAGIVDDFKAFLDEVQLLTGFVPAIYTSPGFWNAVMVPTPPWTDNYPLWVAHWGVPVPILPNGWTDYVIHQTGDQGSVPGVPSAVDENNFNGVLADVYTFFGNGRPAQVRVNLRQLQAAPVVRVPYLREHEIIAYSPNGRVWDVEEVVVNTHGHTFYRVGKAVYLRGDHCEIVT